MKDTFKTILIIATTFMMLSGVAVAATKVFPYQGGTGIDSSALTGIIRVDSGTWSATTTFGSSASRVAKGWFTDLDSTSATIGTLNISGSVNPGPLVVATSTNPTIQFLNDTNTGIGWIDYDKISLMTSETSQLTVDSTGQVGIGTTTPSALLTVGATEGSQFLVNSFGVVTGGTWQGTAIADTYVADNITLTNITQITNRALSSLTGTLNIASTTLTVGRSLTLTGSDIAVDSELFTKPFTFAIKNATTTSNPAGQHSFPTAITITKVKCANSLATVTFQLDERAEATPFTAGTDIMSAALDCGTGLASTTAFANAGIAADNWISLDIDATDNAATSTNITIYFTVDD